jgi:hypothetical protein
MVMSGPRQGAGRLRGCPSRLGAPDFLGRRHDHIARPAPERMPNTNTTTPMIIFAGRLGHSTSVSTVTMWKPF